jgi:sodium-dependent dicarboxylate transporter 2/3/5
MGEPELPSDPPPGYDERISDGEAHFERWRKRLGLWLGPPVGVLVALSGPGDAAQRLAGIMAFAAIWWIGEAVPAAVTALIAAAAVVVCDVAPAKAAFAAFGTPLLFLFIGSFFIAEAMKVHGLGARAARAMARRARGQLSMLVALSTTAFLLSLWMSNAAATAVALPIAISVAQASGDRRYGAAIVLAIAYGASMGGVGTPVGTPPNLIGIAQMHHAGVHIGFLRWMSFGVPLGLLMLAAMWAVLAFRFRLRPGMPLPAQLSSFTRARPWNRGEVAVCVAFAAAVAGWLAPGLLETVEPGSVASRWAATHLTEEVVALLASAMLFLWPVDGERAALTWREAAGIDWSTIFLFGGGILLGDLAGKTGLTARWGEALVSTTGAHSLWGITALMTGVALVLSELTSNTATATLIVPLAITLAQAAHVRIEPPALGATLGASFGFMLPISTAPNAMAYGTGQVSIRQMAGAGILFDMIGYAAIVIGLRLLCPLLGLA